jgi:hypothetical protein
MQNILIIFALFDKNNGGISSIEPDNRPNKASQIWVAGPLV